jgi:hypothetical protein
LHENPFAAISTYLWAVADEARARGYSFDASKIVGKRSQLPSASRLVFKSSRQRSVPDETGGLDAGSNL